ncbi:ABC transporter substrate-binding protein [Nocardioides sp. SYSU DS0663]|uniref:ABC transporter substrate-binding protein n=1 Tax=Nocardioides sp. SYSU DS0663 TaxID=3416445 RepID=UPI003F4BE0BF
MHKIIRSAAVVVASSSLLAACGGDGGGGGTGGGDVDEVVIGAVHPLTGPLAGAGTAMSQAAEMAVQDLNEAGGIECLDGADLRLEAGDSEGAAATGQSEAQRLINEGAVALVGTYQSDVTQNVAAVAERAGVPLVIDVAVDDAILEQGYTNTFRIQPDATSMGTDGGAALLAMAEENGEEIDQVSYIHVEGAFGESVYDAFATLAEENGIEVKAVSYSPTNFSDATTVVREAATGNPDVILSTGYYPDSLLIAQAVEQLDPDIQALYGIANGAFDNSPFPNDAGQAGESVLSANYHFDATKERVQELRDRFEQEYDQPMETAAVLSYQAVEVIEAALEEACSDDPAEVRDAIADIEVDDPLLAFDGPITFDESGQNENATVIVMQVLDGQIEQVFPEEFTTSDLVYPTR